MEVIYEPPICDRLREVNYRAQIENRTIHKVVLTESEASELRAWVGEVNGLYGPSPTIDKFMGLRLEVAKSE